ncbi:hypothetical protein [Pelagovum pacificum]|uniref:VOC domain-containing protein n=1 Tax=Pelagovum pacificum TaxID=2588711 RepID=A0A5C5GHU8_9RHOB|nr:hypothetical protein [Pelagovum pacificum]QQA43364.1 hypothetical protein I8N54_01965 [Pelagovum pacificum]TNY33499.1 hypothetical protein FHY64_09560 [Pelagovum pacificum]
MRILHEMKLLGIRFAHVAPGEDADGIADALKGLGLATADFPEAEGMPGAIFPTTDQSSWVEVWHAGEGMPPGTMLQLIVEDADAAAATAKRSGLNPQGPMDAHGERIYFLALPGGLQMSFQSKL